MGYVDKGAFKTLTMKLLDFTKFFFISVPLACALYLTAHTYFELKRLYNGIRLRAEGIRKQYTS